MSGSTTNYKLTKPTVSGDADVWGSYLNNDMDAIDKLIGAITTGGAANAYTLTSGQTLTAYATGQRFRCKLNFTNGASATLNVDSIGAKTIKKRDASTNCSASDLVSGQIYTFTYDGTNFVVETVLPSDYQPLDATVTAFAGLTTADDRMLDFSGVDTMAVVTYATVLSNLTGNTPTTAGLSVLNFTDPDADQLLFWDDSAGDFVGIATLPYGMSISGTSLLLEQFVEIACSDETTALTTGTNKATFSLPFAITVTGVYCAVNTAGTGLTVDINEDGTTILSTKLTLDSGEKTSLTAATAAVISDTAIAAGAEIGIDIDAVSGTAKGLKVGLKYRRAS